MKRTIITVVAVFLFALPALAETFEHAAIVDKMCAAKAKADPDAHTRACALQCKSSGYGIVTDKGEFLAFDATGNEKTAAALQAAEKKDHLRATVKGTRDGNTIKVEQLTLQ